MAKVLVWLVGCLLVGDAAYAGESNANQFNAAEAFRECSLAQKVKPRALTDAGRHAAESCLRLAMAYEEGKDVDESGKPIAVNYTLASQYHGIGCKLSVALGCLSMGRMVERGQTTIPKGKDLRSVAIGWYTRGCFTEDEETGDVALSCSLGGILAMTLGLEKKDRHVLAKWMKVSFELEERACHLGSDPSCRLLMNIEQTLSAAK